MSATTPQAADAVHPADGAHATRISIHEGALSKNYGNVAHSLANAVNRLYQTVNVVQSRAFGFAIWHVDPQIPADDSSTGASASTAGVTEDLAAHAAALAMEAPQADTTTPTTSAPATGAAHARTGTIARLADDSELRNAGQFAYAIRAGTEAVSTVIDDTGRLMMRNCMSALKIRMTGYCLAEMVRHPEKFDDYQKVLKAIQQME